MFAYPPDSARGDSTEPVPARPKRLPGRVARSGLWPLILGGRPNPVRQSEALLRLEIEPLEEDGPGLRLTGELDVLSVLQLERALADADLPIPFVLDLSGVAFMDGVGASLLMKLAEMADGKPAVILQDPSRPVARVLVIAAPDGIPGLEVRWTAPQ
jgi:anti-anti-sigma factor